MRSLLLRLLFFLCFTAALSAQPNRNRFRRYDSSSASVSSNTTSLSNSTTTSTTTDATSSLLLSSTTTQDESASSPSSPLSDASSPTPDVKAPTPIPVGQVTETPTPISVGKISSTTSASITAIGPGKISMANQSSVTPIAVGTLSAAQQINLSDTPTPIPVGSLTRTTVTPQMVDFGQPTATAPLSGGTGAVSPPLVTGGVTAPYPFGNQTVSPPYPLGNGTGTGAAQPTGTGLDVCGGCTVYARGASVDYWFPATYDYAIGTLSTVKYRNTTSWYTLAPATSTFDVTSAVATLGAYTTTVSYFSEWDFYVTFMDSYTLVPGAVSTAVVPRSSVLPVTGTVAINKVDSLSVDPGPATVAVPLPSGTASTATSTTPFVYFSGYQVEREALSTQDDGQIVCATATASFNMSRPFAFDYEGDSVETASSAQGDLPTEFVKQIPQSSCVAGQWYGEVTVLIVVNLLYDIEFNPEPFVQHVESSVSVTGFPINTGGLQPDAGHLASSTAAVTVAGDGGLGGIIASIIGQAQSTSVQRGAGLGGLQPNAGSISRTANAGGQTGIPMTQIQFPTGGDDNSGGGDSQGQSPTSGNQNNDNSGGGQTQGQSPTGGNNNGNNNNGNSNNGNSNNGNGNNENSNNGNGNSGNSNNGNNNNGNNNAGGAAGGGVTPTSVVVIGTNTATIGSSSQVIIGGQTLTPGGPAITVDNTPVSLAPSATAIVIGGTTAIVAHGATSGAVVVVAPSTTPAPVAVPVITVGSTTITGNAATQFFFGPGSTLTPGGTVVVSGTTVSLDSSASFVVVGGTTQVLPTPAPSIGAAFTVSGTTITGNSGSTFVIQGQTLTPGGSPITVDGPQGKTTISLASGGSSVVVNGATQQVTPVITPAPLVIGGSTFSVTDDSTFVLGSTTIKPGDVVTITDSQGHETTVSIGPSATYAVVNGVTTTLVPSAMITQAPLLTVGGIVYTALPGGTTYVIDGSTLVPGSSIVVSGTTISLAPYATALIVNGHTTTLFPATTTLSAQFASATSSRSGITAETASNTGAAASPTGKKKGSAISIRGGKDFLPLCISAFLGTLVAGVSLWL